MGFGFNWIVHLCIVQKKSICVLMIVHECKNCVIANFVKFGGGDAMHHNRTMLEECIYVVITSCILVGAHLPYLEHDHDLPFRMVNIAIGYIILKIHHKFLIINKCIFHICKL